MWTMNFHMFKLVLEKAEEPEIKWPTSSGSWKKQESSRKTSIFCFIDYAKAFDCVDHNKLWKILKEMGPDYLEHGSWEGNGNPLQYSCLENPRDCRAWWAVVYGVTQSRTRLKRLSSSSSLILPWNVSSVHLYLYFLFNKILSSYFFYFFNCSFLYSLSIFTIALWSLFLLNSKHIHYYRQLLLLIFFFHISFFADEKDKFYRFCNTSGYTPS